MYVLSIERGLSPRTCTLRAPPVYLIDVSYFDLIFLKQVEGTRNDKVCRLLNTLVEIGTNAYQAFLNVLKTTGYEFLANQIVQNEEMIRRENPFISTPIQETNQPAEEIRPSPIPFELRNYTSAGQSSFVGSQIQNSNSSSLEASGSSTIIYSRTSEFSLPPSRSTRINSEPPPVGLFDWERGKFWRHNQIKIIQIKGMKQDVKYYDKLGEGRTTPW